MHRLFFPLFLLSPLLTLWIFFITDPDRVAASGIDVFTWDLGDLFVWSKILGLVAFTYLAGQFFLASKPLSIDKKIGAKKYQTFHIVVGFLGLGALISHLILKLFFFGYGPSLQTFFGFIALLLIVLLIFVAILLMANTFVAQAPLTKTLREITQKKWGWTYKRLRMIHSLMTLALLSLLIHILLAASTQASWISITYTSVYFGLCLFSYVAYRLRNRRS